MIAWPHILERLERLETYGPLGDAAAELHALEPEGDIAPRLTWQQERVLRDICPEHELPRIVVAIPTREEPGMGWDEDAALASLGPHVRAEMNRRQCPWHGGESGHADCLLSDIADGATAGQSAETVRAVREAIEANRRMGVVRDGEPYIAGVAESPASMIQQARDEAALGRIERRLDAFRRWQGRDAY